MKKHDLRFILKDVAGGSGTRHRNFDLKKSYEQEIWSIPRITKEEELELARKSRNGENEARELLVYHNLRSVMKIAWEKSGYLFFDNTIAFEDLFNAGAEGLTLAAERYEPRQETKFISYAIHWTRECIRREIRYSQRVRIKNPEYHYRMKEYLLNKRNLWSQTGVEPLVDEVADCMGIELQDAIDLHSTSLAADKPDNLDDHADYGPEGEIEYSHFEDASCESDYMSDTDRDTICKRAKNILSSVDEYVLISVYGLSNNDGRAISPQEVAKHLGSTPQRIYQILAKARKRLRRDPVIIEITGRNPWKDPRVWTGSSYKIESVFLEAIKNQADRSAGVTQLHKHLITGKAKRKGEETRQMLDEIMEPQIYNDEMPTKVETRSSRMDESEQASLDVTAFVRTCLAFHGYVERNPFHHPKAPNWLIPSLRGPIVHLLLERRVELWEMEKILGEVQPEILLKERRRVMTNLKRNPNFLLPLKLWLDKYLET